MKSLNLLVTLSLLLPLIACAPADTNGTGDASNTDGTEATNKLSRYAPQLAGTWKRQSYPYGTIEFRGNQVKYAAGEGAAEPARFQDFELSATCAGQTGNNATKENYDFGINTGNGNCDAIRLNDNSFTIYYGGGNSGVEYRKQGTSTDGMAGAGAGERLLPLEPGFYVATGAGCDNPANANWRYWNGMGINGSATQSCTLELLEREGNNYLVSQTCTNTYDKSRTATEFTVIVRDVNTFSLAGADDNQTFTFCENTPDWFEGGR